MHMSKENQEFFLTMIREIEAARRTPSSNLKPRLRQMMIEIQEVQPPELRTTSPLAGISPENWLEAAQAGNSAILFITQAMRSYIGLEHSLTPDAEVFVKEIAQKQSAENLLIAAGSSGYSIDDSHSNIIFTDETMRRNYHFCQLNDIADHVLEYLTTKESELRPDLSYREYLDKFADTQGTEGRFRFIFPIMPKMIGQAYAYASMGAVFGAYGAHLAKGHDLKEMLSLARKTPAFEYFSSAFQPK